LVANDFTTSPLFPIARRLRSVTLVKFSSSQFLERHFILQLKLRSIFQ
jgi:hypothetical protein